MNHHKHDFLDIIFVPSPSSRSTPTEIILPAFPSTVSTSFNMTFLSNFLKAPPSYARVLSSSNSLLIAPYSPKCSPSWISVTSLGEHNINVNSDTVDVPKRQKLTKLKWTPMDLQSPLIAVTQLLLWKSQNAPKEVCNTPSVKKAFNEQQKRTRVLWVNLNPPSISTSSGRTSNVWRFFCFGRMQTSVLHGKCKK